MRTNGRRIIYFKKPVMLVVLPVLFLLITPASSFGQPCNMEALPSIEFRPNSVKILKSADSLLRLVANQLRANPTCKLKVIGYGNDCKKCLQLSWDHVNTAINFLIEKEGISPDRLIFLYAQDGGSPTVVDLMPTAEEGVNSVPPPFPNLRRNR